MTSNGLRGRVLFPDHGGSGLGEVPRVREIARHLSHALSRYVRQLHQEGRPVPRELVDLAALLGLLARSCQEMPSSCQEMTTVADNVPGDHPTRMAERLLITTSEAAERLGVSVRTVHRLAASGRLPRVRIERLVRFRVSDVEAYVQSLSPSQAPEADSGSPG
jgi:excisionase family DNA binding protein